MLDLIKLSKSYGSKSVLANVTLSLTPSCVGILGKNGTGKTTLLNIISSAIKKDGGDIHFNNKSIYSDLKLWKRRVGVVPEFPELFENLTIYEHMKLSVELYNITINNEEMDEYLNYFDLNPYRDYFIEECSQGMKKKLSIILGIIHNPSVLILDEPFNGLDIESVILLKKLIHNFNKNRDKLILITSHMLESLDNIIDNVLLINNCGIEYNSLKDIHKEYNSLEEYYLCQKRYALV